MNQEEYLGSFAKDFAKFYDELISTEKSEDYEVNPVQWRRLMDIIQFFYDKIDVTDKMHPVKLIPQKIVGGATAEFVLFHVCGEEVSKFCEVLQHASAFSLDANLKGMVIMSVTVPNVFKKKTT